MKLRYTFCFIILLYFSNTYSQPTRIDTTKCEQLTWKQLDSLCIALLSTSSRFDTLRLTFDDAITLVRLENLKLDWPAIDYLPSYKEFMDRIGNSEPLGLYIINLLNAKEITAGMGLYSRSHDIYIGGVSKTPNNRSKFCLN